MAGHKAGKAIRVRMAFLVKTYFQNRMEVKYGWLPLSDFLPAPALSAE
jgi:hypothetical protein